MVGGERERGGGGSFIKDLCCVAHPELIVRFKNRTVLCLSENVLSLPFSVSSQQRNAVSIFRISTVFNETFRYDSAHLRKVSFDTSNIMLILCGRNRVTSQSQPIACLSIPFSGCVNYATPDWHPMLYRITFPDGHYDDGQQQPLGSSSSWEQQGMFDKRGQ